MSFLDVTSLRPVGAWDPDGRDVVPPTGALRVEVASHSGDSAARVLRVPLG